MEWFTESHFDALAIECRDRIPNTTLESWRVVLQELGAASERMADLFRVDRVIEPPAEEIEPASEEAKE